MILVDTSVWIGHLRAGDARLADLLERGLVLVHPFVIGELALGNLGRRAAVLGALLDLPTAAVASEPEVLGFIERWRLNDRGIGYIDAHLLAATRLTPETLLWTRDRGLAAVAGELSLAADVQ